MPGLALVLPFLYALMAVCGLSDGNMVTDPIASSACTAASALIGASYSTSMYDDAVVLSLLAYLYVLLVLFCLCVRCVCSLQWTAFADQGVSCRELD